MGEETPIYGLDRYLPPQGVVERASILKKNIILPLPFRRSVPGVILSSWNERSSSSFPELSFIYAGPAFIVAADFAKNIGVWFDNTLSMKKHVKFLCKTTFYHVRNLATVRRFLSHKH